jgi:hypothetical protein
VLLLEPLPMCLGQKFGQRTTPERAQCQQGRQDSNLQPPVLETGALPIAPRPWAAGRLYPHPAGRLPPYVRHG